MFVEKAATRGCCPNQNMKRWCQASSSKTSRKKSQVVPLSLHQKAKLCTFPSSFSSDKEEPLFVFMGEKKRKILTLLYRISLALALGPITLKCVMFSLYPVLILWSSWHPSHRDYNSRSENILYTSLPRAWYWASADIWIVFFGDILHEGKSDLSPGCLTSGSVRTQRAVSKTCPAHCSMSHTGSSFQSFLTSRMCYSFILLTTSQSLRVFGTEHTCQYGGPHRGMLPWSEGLYLFAICMWMA